MIIEATSALDLTAEESMYRLLQEADITYLSVGHRPSLLQYHNQKFVLGSVGNHPKIFNIENRLNETNSLEIMDLSR
jgi:putative ATP-binding cassette transporter